MRKLSLQERLRTARAKSGLTLRALAAESGLTLASVANLESVGGDPKLSTLRKLAGALGVSVGKLVD